MFIGLSLIKNLQLFYDFRHVKDCNCWNEIFVMHRKMFVLSFSIGLLSYYNLENSTLTIHNVLRTKLALCFLGSIILLYFLT